MGSQLGQTTGLRAAHCKNGANDGIFVARRYVSASNSNVVEKEFGIWSIRSYLCLFLSYERSLDPRSCNNRNHLKSRLGIQSEVAGVRDDMSDIVQIDDAA